MKKRVTALFSIILSLTVVMPTAVQATTSILPVSSNLEQNKLTDTQKQIDEYNKTIENFRTANADQLRSRINVGDSFFLYVGRSSGAWCRKLVPVLNEIATEQNLTIFYLDSEKAQQDTNLKDFMNEYDISFVPTIRYFSKDKTSSTIPITAISNDINKQALLQSMSEYIEIMNSEKSQVTDEYEVVVQDFAQIKAEEVTAKINNGDSFFLYTGRGTCPWCRKFVPVLNEVAKEQNIVIYYLDSENTQQDANLSSFRDTYTIKSVPTFMYFAKDNKYSTLEIKTTSSGSYDKELLKETMINVQQ